MCLLVPVDLGTLILLRLKFPSPFHDCGVDKAWVPPPPVGSWTTAHVAGVVSDGGSCCYHVVAATGSAIIHHRLLLILGDPLEAAEEERGEGFLAVCSGGSRVWKGGFHAHVHSSNHAPF